MDLDVMMRCTRAKKDELTYHLWGNRSACDIVWTRQGLRVNSIDRPFGCTQNNLNVDYQILLLRLNEGKDVWVIKKINIQANRTPYCCYSSCLLTVYVLLRLNFHPCFVFIVLFAVLLRCLLWSRTHGPTAMFVCACWWRLTPCFGKFATSRDCGLPAERPKLFLKRAWGLRLWYVPYRTVIHGLILTCEENVFPLTCRTDKLRNTKRCVCASISNRLYRALTVDV